MDDKDIVMQLAFAIADIWVSFIRGCHQDTVPR